MAGPAPALVGRRAASARAAGAGEGRGRCGARAWAGARGGPPRSVSKAGPAPARARSPGASPRAPPALTQANIGAAGENKTRSSDSYNVPLTQCQSSGSASPISGSPRAACEGAGTAGGGAWRGLGWGWGGVSRLATHQPCHPPACSLIARTPVVQRGHRRPHHPPAHHPPTHPPTHLLLDGGKPVLQRGQVQRGHRRHLALQPPQRRQLGGAGGYGVGSERGCESAGVWVWASKVNGRRALAHAAVATGRRRPRVQPHHPKKKQRRATTWDGAHRGADAFPSQRPRQPSTGRAGGRAGDGQHRRRGGPAPGTAPRHPSQRPSQHQAQCPAQDSGHLVTRAVRGQGARRCEHTFRLPTGAHDSQRRRTAAAPPCHICCPSPGRPPARR